MQMSIYCVYDRVAKTYYTPFFMYNDDHAKRTFMQMQRDENTPMHNSPEDFDLYHIGYFGNESGLAEGGIQELVMRGMHNANVKPVKLEDVSNA